MPQKYPNVKDIRMGSVQRKQSRENRIRSNSLNDGIDKFGWSSLLKAVSRNNLDAVYEILREPNVDVDKAHEPFGWTPLLIAVQKSNMTITEILLEHNANVDKQNCAGVSCLHEAARLNNQKMIQKLLDYRANPLTLDRFGRPPRSKMEHINALMEKAKFEWRFNNIRSVKYIPVLNDIQMIILKYIH